MHAVVHWLIRKRKPVYILAHNPVDSTRRLVKINTKKKEREKRLESDVVKPNMPHIWLFPLCRDPESTYNFSYGKYAKYTKADASIFVPTT